MAIDSWEERRNHRFSKCFSFFQKESWELWVASLRQISRRTSRLTTEQSHDRRIRRRSPCRVCPRQYPGPRPGAPNRRSSEVRRSRRRGGVGDPPTMRRSYCGGMYLGGVARPYSVRCRGRRQHTNLLPFGSPPSFTVASGRPGQQVVAKHQVSALSPRRHRHEHAIRQSVQHRLERGAWSGRERPARRAGGRQSPGPWAWPTCRHPGASPSRRCRSRGSGRGGTRHRVDGLLPGPSVRRGRTTRCNDLASSPSAYGPETPARIRSTAFLATLDECCLPRHGERHDCP